MDLIFEMGWYKTDFEDENGHIFHTSSCCIQPPRAKCTVIGYSDDC